MTLLSICQDAASAVGFPRPSSIAGSSDETSRRLFRLANQEGKELARRHDWEVLIKEASFTTVATESQGALTTIASDFDRIVNGTMNDRTENEPVMGPLSSTEWQRLKADEVEVASYSWFRIRGAEVLFYPTPPAGNSIYFEYVSTDWCQSSGASAQSAWAADNDTGILSEELITLGLVWRFKKSLGLPYGDEFNEYENAVRQDAAREGAAATLNMGGDKLRDVVNLPNGNFTL